jgi:diamine N-acetyltransferase
MTCAGAPRSAVDVFDCTGFVHHACQQQASPQSLIPMTMARRTRDAGPHGTPSFFLRLERITTRRRAKVAADPASVSALYPASFEVRAISVPLAAISTDIVEATDADIPLVARLAHEIWHRHYPGIISREQIDYMLEHGYSQAALTRYFVTPGAGLALARRGGSVAGFVGWYRLDAGDEMKLDKLYVLPQEHGQGIGRALIEHVASLARAVRCRFVTLNVNRNNVRAVRVYEHCGFVIRERGDFPIGNGFVMEDFVMARELRY